MTRRTAIRAAVAAALAAAAVLVAPLAHAYPGDPMPGCITDFGSVLCDGPIRPDGTFQRCWSNPGSYFPGWGYVPPSYVPPMTNCEIVDTNQPWPVIPLGAPQYHVG